MYQGPERRKSQREFCEAHISMCEDIAVIKATVINLDKRINGSIGAIEHHIDNSRGRNITIITTLVTIILFLFGIAYSMGESKRQIEVNTTRLSKLEDTNGR